MGNVVESIEEHGDVESLVDEMKPFFIFESIEYERNIFQSPKIDIAYLIFNKVKNC